MANILVVDDDPDIRQVLEEILADEGHSVRGARDGAEALDAASAAYPDVVLLDVGLPFLSGPEVARRMFIHDAGLEQIPIVLLSAYLDLPSVARSIGTPYFMRKPFSVTALLAMVRRALTERTPPKPDCDRDGG